GDRAGLVRYGWATLPMDEVMVTVAVDFCGRPAFVWRVQGLEGKWIGDYDCELTKEFFAAFATRAQCNLHVVLHYGGNLRSVERALAHVGADVVVTHDPDVVARADKLVVPGQGAFGPFMRGIVER